MKIPHINIFLSVFTILLFKVISQGKLSFIEENTTTDINVPIWLNSSISQYNRFITDKYNYFITPQGNKVWVCAMNLAWNQMKRNFLHGQNATFQNMTTFQQHMIDNLNSQIFTKDQLSTDAYYVFSGYGQKTIQRINLDITQKFPLRTLPNLDSQLNDTDFISYAYLFKNFQFKVPFKHSPNFGFKSQIVDGFEGFGTKQKRQIYEKYYNNGNDFMIGIQTKSPNDEIILWKTNMTDMRDVKIQKVLQMFNLFYELPSKTLNSWDQFRMPVIDLDLTRSYKDLLDLRFANQKHNDYVIKTMNERIKLKITRFGVQLQSQGEIVMIATSIRDARYFVLNSDFWVFLKQKNKQPYLVSLISYVDQVWAE